jgi:hypothetical protein
MGVEVVLPDDNYGFILENDRDLISLKYLISEIGEEKLLKSLLKYKRNGLALVLMYQLFSSGTA